jgi:hypothetical protein
MAESLAPRPVEFLWRPDAQRPRHPNGFVLEALPTLYRETATGGLARIYEKRLAESP